MRLQKFLARAGAASRRGSEDLMTAGRVRVNGAVVCELGSKVDPSVDVVEVDGIPVSLRDTHTYLMLNKPPGFLTTMDDPHGRPTVRGLVPHERHPGLFPVGRLDYDTTGLLLFMTDGELAHRLLHPSREVSKRYVAEVDGVFTEQDAELLRKGVVLNDGLTLPAEVEILTPGQDPALNKHHAKQLKKPNTNERAQIVAGTLPTVTTEVAIAVTEGRKRQVKRMCAFVGRPVLRLHRESFGPLGLSGLGQGEWRYLSEQEVAGLRMRVL